MSINSFRKPFTVAASAVLLSTTGAGVAQAAAARPPHAWTVSAQGFGGPSPAGRAALARKLGVTPGQLDAVMRGSRSQLATANATGSAAAAGATGAADPTA